jgi:ABC-type sulfate transport system permease subunit
VTHLGFNLRMMLLAGYAPYLPFLALGLVALSQGVGQFEMNIVHKGQINAVPLPVLVPLILALSLVLLLSPSTRSI